jgi:hypothetical protein
MFVYVIPHREHEHVPIILTLEIQVCRATLALHADIAAILLIWLALTVKETPVT